MNSFLKGFSDELIKLAIIYSPKAPQPRTTDPRDEPGASYPDLPSKREYYKRVQKSFDFTKK